MRQSNGVALFSAGDPRGTIIGIIEAAAEDDRQNILTAILTQEKLKRKQTVLVLPAQSEAFQRPVDFKEFESTLHDLQTELIFVLPSDSNLARLIRQHRYTVFSSLENYAQYARRFLSTPSTPSPASSSPEENTPDPAEAAPAEQTAAPVVSASAPTSEDQPTAAPVVPQSEPSDEEEDEEDEAEEPAPASPIPQRASLFRHPPAASTNGEASPAGPEQDTSGAAPPAVQAASSPRRVRSPRRIWVLALLAMVVIVLIGGLLGTLEGVLPLAVLFPSITSATVTITPDSQMFQQPYQIAAITTLADGAQRQVQARFLSVTTASQTKTVATTGTGSYPAQHAQGALTFYNALPEAQKVPKGTVITDDKGIQVINDEDAFVPGAQPPQEGSFTVAAHAVLAGAQGNTFQLAGTLSCCHPGISVKNEDNFHDGQDARSYNYVQQSDIDAASHTLTTGLISTGQNAFKAQVAPGERLVGGPQCLPDTFADPAAGVQAKTVTVTIKITCTGEVYDQQAAQQLAEFLLKTDVEKRIGSDYALQNHITTTVNTVQKKDASGTLQVQITAAGLWGYQFHEEQKLAFARLIAGQKANQAVTTLLQQRGVHKAKIDLSFAYDNTLPGNPQQIMVIWQSPS